MLQNAVTKLMTGPKARVVLMLVDIPASQACVTLEKQRTGAVVLDVLRERV